MRFTLRDYTEVELATLRPRQLASHDLHELTSRATKGIWWNFTIGFHFDLKEKLAEMRRKPARLQVVIAHAVLALVRVGLKADHGSALISGTYRPHRIYTTSDYSTALLQALINAHAIKWATPRIALPCPRRMSGRQMGPRLRRIVSPTATALLETIHEVSEE